MKTSEYFLFVCATVGLISAREETSALPASGYLEKKLREIKLDIAKSHSQDAATAAAQSYDVQWGPLWNRYVESDNPLALSFLNETFVLADGRVLRVKLEKSAKLHLSEVAVVKQEKATKFVRSIAWNGLLFLLICQENESCSLYVGPNVNELHHRQFVKHRKILMDARFFTQENQMYLIIAFNSGEFTVPSVIYRWTGTYMDVIVEIPTTGAVSITTFNYKQSTIIIIAQNVKEQPKIGSEVFTFKSGAVEKTQFLATDGPISIHYYEYEEKIFLLVVNEVSASTVFWWDGKELLNWMELPELKSPTKVEIINMDQNTLLLVSQQNTLSLYRIQNLAYTRLKLLEMKNGYIITDFNARVEGNSIYLVLVRKSGDNMSLIEVFELVIKRFDQGGSIAETDSTLQYLMQLDQLLRERMPAIEKAYKSWPSLHSFSEDVVDSSPLKLDEVIINSGSISELIISSPAEVLTPTELASGLEQLNSEADSLILQSRNLLLVNETAEPVGKVIVEGDAYFDEMHIDSLTVTTLNGQKVDLDVVLSYTKDQNFNEPLRGSEVTIENLEIDSLCGIPFRNWQKVDATDQTVLDISAGDVKILNDTILVQSNLSVNNLGLSRLNNIHLQTFLNDLFRIGRNQEIKGNIIFKQGLKTDHLRVNISNGINTDDLLTRTTDQILGNMTIKSLDIEDLFVTAINNVPINDAARISKENVISGQVTLRKFVVTEEFDCRGVPQIIDLRPSQIYKDVEINGNLMIRDLELNPGCSLYLNGVRVDVDSLFKNYWSKTSDQKINKDVTLAGGITIDDLHVKYLNGLKEDDILYTTVTEIPDKFGTLHFKRFENQGAISTENEEPIESFETNGIFVINQRVRIKDLKVRNLNAQSYNRIPIEDIVNANINVNTMIHLPGTTRYENIVVSKDITVGKLRAEYLNSQNLTDFFEKALYLDNNYVVDYLELDRLETDNFEVQELNNLRMIDFYRMLMYKDITGIKNVTVQGDLQITENLNVEIINDLRSADYVRRLSNDDIITLKGLLVIENFEIFGNLSVSSLNDIEIEELVANTLSRTKPQTITGFYSFQNINTEFLISEKINDRDVKSLQLISDPLIINGNIEFSNLIVHGDVVTGYVNDLDIAETFDNALRIPFTEIENLIIDGRISWKNSSMDPKSLSYIFEKAVTKNTNQTIEAEVTFEDNICAFKLTSPQFISGVNIPGIVSDAVIPDGRPLDIGGEKYFSKGLIAKYLTVSGDIGIDYVDNWNILHLNSTIVRKFESQIITKATVFRNDVTIEKLEVSGKVHGSETQGISTVGGNLPNNVKFLNIEVKDDLSTNKIDGVELKEFINNRVTLDGHHEIYGDIIFTNPVVTENTDLSSINGIEVSDIVLNEAEDIQVITSEKTLQNDLIIRGNITVDTINEIGVTEEYENGVFNNEDIHIRGNIIFSADLEILSNISVSGSINGGNLTQISNDVSLEARSILTNLESSQFWIDKKIDSSISASKFLPDVFYYFDEQPELAIRAPNIQKVQSLAVESMVKLNLYGAKKGRYCGLPDFCFCPDQYVAELLDHECKIWRVDGSRMIYNFHDPEGKFGVNVVSNTTSSSLLCSQNDPVSEFISISWMTAGKLSTGHLSGQIRNDSARIYGYLSDAATFKIADKIYVVLAIYYDPRLKTHDTYSLVYEIDLNRNKMELAQNILTNGAAAINIFTTATHGIFLLIACKHNPANSQLRRFNMLNSKFELLRTFQTGGSRNAKSLIQGEEMFVLLDDSVANSVHIFSYNLEFDNFHLYQSLYHNSPVKKIEVFYSGEPGYSDAFVIVTTEEAQFFVYEYMFFGGFQLRVQQWLDGVQTMVPFYFAQRQYIFAGTVANSTIYRIVQQGPQYSYT